MTVPERHRNRAVPATTSRPHQDRLPASADEQFEELLEQSSLGTPQARRLRAGTSLATARMIIAMAGAAGDRAGPAGT